MSEITTIGLDLAKHVFQVHGIDAQGTTVLRKRLRRGQVLAFFSRIPRCVVGLEACATAHYWFITLLGRWQITEGYNSGARIQESTS
jgi:transposase